jgi:hypothetical protein
MPLREKTVSQYFCCPSFTADRIFVRWIDNSSVEQVDDPAMYLSLYGVLFVCKSYYFECLIKELGINSNTSSNTTYKPTSFDKDEILGNHRSFMTSLSIPSGNESEDLSRKILI